MSDARTDRMSMLIQTLAAISAHSRGRRRTGVRSAGPNSGASARAKLRRLRAPRRSLRQRRQSKQRLFPGWPDSFLGRPTGTPRGPLALRPCGERSASPHRFMLSTHPGFASQLPRRGPRTACAPPRRASPSGKPVGQEPPSRPRAGRRPGGDRPPGSRAVHLYRSDSDPGEYWWPASSRAKMPTYRTGARRSRGSGSCACASSWRAIRSGATARSSWRIRLTPRSPARSSRPTPDRDRPHAARGDAPSHAAAPPQSA